MIPKPPAPKQNKGRLFIGAMLGLVVLGGVVSALTSGGKSRPRSVAKPDMISITLPPPPPPPPPPPKDPPPEPETVKEEKFTPEQPPEPEPQAAPEPAPLGTNIEGNGPDAFGLSKGGGNGMIGGTGTGKGGKGSKYGAFAGQVQSKVVQSLRNHKKTKSATLNVKVRVWVDSTGRVTRSTLEGSTGDPATDAAITQEILTGLQLQGAPPEGMPMPIVMRLQATRPN